MTESRSSRAAYVIVDRKVHYHRKSIQVNAAIKILLVLVNLADTSITHSFAITVPSFRWIYTRKGPEQN